jgi:von Willebrand factor A domain-containing protein 8
MYQLSLIGAPCSLSAGPLGLDAAREAAKREALEIRFDPTGNTDLSEPKEGKHDPDNDAHVGGNTWAGGVSFCLAFSDASDCILMPTQSGGRDTAGLGGRGGYKRLWKGHKIKQARPSLPQHAKATAR